MKNYSHPVVEQFNLIVSSGGDDSQVHYSRDNLIKHFTDVVRVSYGHAIFLADGIVFDAFEELRLRESKQ